MLQWLRRLRDERRALGWGPDTAWRSRRFRTNCDGRVPALRLPGLQDEELAAAFEENVRRPSAVS